MRLRSSGVLGCCGIPGSVSGAGGGAETREGTENGMIKMNGALTEMNPVCHDSPTS